MGGIHSFRRLDVLVSDDPCIHQDFSWYTHSNSFELAEGLNFDLYKGEKVRTPSPD